MKKIFLFAPIFLAFVFGVCSMIPTVKMSEDISNNVLRLHILANSDSEYDQELKFRVRDRILAVTENIYANCNSVDEAVNASKENVNLIREAAQKTIAFYGCSDEARVNIVKEYFSTRYYDSFVLPAGIYYAVKVEIGEAKGHNWWCVMFPTVCISGCTDDFDDTLTPQERRMIEEKGYTVRFKAVEIYEKIKSKLE